MEGWFGAFEMTNWVIESPEVLGFNKHKLRMAAQSVSEECEKGSFPGAVCLVARKGKIALAQAFGTLSPTRNTQVTLDTVFDMASITKPMTTALMALMLAERGKLSFWQTVPEFFKERGLPHLEGVNLKMLITHTSGLPAWIDLYTDTSDRAGAIEMLLRTPLKYAPGTHYEYSCLGYILLGLIIERIAGETLQDFLLREVWQSLGMTSTGFIPAPDVYDKIASTDLCPAREHEIIGEVNDGNAWRMGGISGNAGLFSTAADVFRYCDLLLHPSHPDAFLSRLAMQRYTTTQIPPETGAQSFGWFCYGSDMLPAGDLLPPGTFGHTGYTGTSVVIAPSEELIVILLTNRVCTDHDGSQIRRARRRFHNLVASAII